jgi:surfactin synthase thioesterase subunit/glycosyltransferase involved in cell wall biosynthesis
MRILLAQNSLYYPAHGGGDKSNRLLLEALAERGHSCRVVARVGTEIGVDAEQHYLRELAARSVEITHVEDGAVCFHHNGVEVHAVTSNPNLRAYLARQIEAFTPQVILTSSDDPTQILLDVALESGAPVVYLARTTLALPFGPEGAFESEAKTALLRRVAGVAAVSQYVADYIRRFSGIPAVAPPLSLLGTGPYPHLGRFDNPFVTMVNPCAVKGIAIFLELARALPQVAFAAVPMWGTNQNDDAALRAEANITLLEPVDNIDRLLERTRVMLVPSLWAEARSRIVVESMLRGVPVLAANTGGIPEAMMGVDYLLPVTPIVHYRPEVDESMVPVADVPPQDVRPWLAALNHLLNSRDAYQALSHRARQAALNYAANLSVKPFEEFLHTVLHKVAEPVALSAATRLAAEAPASSSFDRLSDQKRALLALRLRKKQVAVAAPAAKPNAGVATGSTSSTWFPFTRRDESARLRLFCFPYAGGGASAFLNWGNQFPASIAVAPVRLPGREARLAESPCQDVGFMVGGLFEAVQPLLDRPFAFFGHSMGGMISFELARELRRKGLPQPLGLFVSSARAPQFRFGHQAMAEPSEQEFLEELRKREGTPRELLENEELMRLVLPAIRADAAVCRTYSYLPEAPFDFPIVAYGGSGDGNLRPEHIEAWREQTIAKFRMQLFPGGHFFLHTAADEFIPVLARDVEQVAAAIRTQP